MQAALLIFFFCAIFSYICFLKPATTKTEAIFVPVHILQSGQSSVSVPQASRSHPRKVALPQRNSFFSSVTAQENVTGNPVNCYFLPICHRLHQFFFVPGSIWRETAMLQRLAPWKNKRRLKSKARLEGGKKS